MRKDGDEIYITELELEILSIFMSHGITDDETISEELMRLIKKLS